MHTAAHEQFIAPARTTPEVWRLLGGVVIVFLTLIAWILLLMGVVFAALGLDFPALEEWMRRMALGATPTSVLLMLSTFVGFFGGTLLAAKLLHRRGLRSLLGRNIRKPFFASMAISAAIICLGAVLFPTDLALEEKTPITIWLSFLPLAIALLLVQTGAEELLFRGYIQQQLAARFQNPLIWMLIPSIAFGLLHIDPEAPALASWMIMGATTLFGLCAADLTRVTGNLGMAWGWHFTNNFFAVAVISTEGPLAGYGLYAVAVSTSDIATFAPLVLRDCMFMVVIWATLRALCARASQKTN